MIQIYYPLAEFEPLPVAQTEAETPALAHTSSHAAEGVERLLEQYQRKPRLEGALAVQLDEVQQLEDALWQLLTERWIDSAVGDQLDVLGRVVNLERGANGDQAYRLLLKVEILSLRSSGRAEELLALATAIFGVDGFELLDVHDLDPEGDDTQAAAMIRAHAEELALPVEFYRRLFRRAAAAGVRLFFEYLGAPPEESFSFSAFDSIHESATQGFGSSSDLSVGGKFAGVTT